LLIAQSGLHQTSFAFAPMRVRTRAGKQAIQINPFGTYTGRQLRYPTAVTGLGRVMALLTADQLDSYAPSYAGRVSRFRLMIVRYDGGRPPGPVQAAAMAFSEPAISGAARANLAAM